MLLGLGGIAAELGGRKFWQPCVFIDAQHVFHQGTHWLGFVHRIHSLSDDRNTGKHTEPIGIRQKLVARRDLAFFVLNRFGTQHQVREIQVPFVRWCVRTFGHVAQVAQIALIHDLHVVGLGDTIDFHRV